MKPNIPKMSQTKLKKWIKVCKELLAYYCGDGEMEDCPLCKVALGYCYDCNDNKFCPWYWFAGMSCVDYSEREYNENVIDLRDEKHPRWVRNRKRQLKKWIAELERRLK